MAKKQYAAKAEKPEAAPAAPAPDAQPEKKEPKKAKQPKGKTAPVAQTGAAPPAPPTPAAASPAAPAAAKPAPEGEVKKRKKQPGHPPPLGKKLRNHLRNLRQKLTSEGPVPLKRAIGLLKQAKRVKFDETVEVHMSLGVDTTQNDQMVRGSVPLPHGIGKAVRVLLFCQGDNVAKAKEAGADHAGGDDLIKKIQQEGWLGEPAREDSRSPWPHADAQSRDGHHGRRGCGS